ncbi:telomere zinc finger-associated protein-like [Contarinia nasturtii]|uniref:telomere zinc finger-associated protein-like n=1 Tax=Contarinia nasturtii TaxID=265458 RepID=UPI0012D47AA5|nr:telomere zinc finger-associated protein-like [Contarinia nasturtii]
MEDLDICIKEENYDGFEESFNDLSTPSVDAMVKEEKYDYADYVVYQSVPWEQNEEQNVVKEHTLFEYEKDSIINTEIKIEESVLADNSQLAEVNVCLSQSQNKTKQTKRSRKTAGTKTKSKKNQVNPKAKYIQCEYCCEKFITQLSLITHTHRCHSKVLKFKCRVCTMRFIDVEQTKNHESDCKIRRYECYLCGYSFFASIMATFFGSFS